MLYFKVDLKYVMVCIVECEYLFDEVLIYFESEFVECFICLYCVVLVGKLVLVGFEKVVDEDVDVYGWVLLCGVFEKLLVSCC